MDFGEIRVVRSPKLVDVIDSRFQVSEMRRLLTNEKNRDTIVEQKFYPGRKNTAPSSISESGGRPLHRWTIYNNKLYVHTELTTAQNGSK